MLAVASALETLRSAIATTGVIPFTLPPSCRFPPLREGNRAGVRFPLPAGGTLRRGLQLLFFVNFSLAIGIRRGVGAHGGAPCCAFPPQGGRRGLWSAEAPLPSNAEASASALQTGQRTAPLSHAVGEGLGVREDYRLRRRSPTSPASPAPNANRLAGSGTNCKRTSSINGPNALLVTVRLVKLRV